LKKRGRKIESVSSLDPVEDSASAAVSRKKGTRVAEADDYDFKNDYK